MAALVNRTALVAPARAPARSRQASVICRAQAPEVDRRAVLGMIAASAPLLASSPAFAAYGDSANVFGKVTNRTGFLPFAGEGFSLLLPSKWNPSKEKDFDGVVLRYEDNSDAVTNLTVLKQKSEKASIDAYGSPEDVLKQLSYLLGKQSYDGETISEGGFAPNRVSAASLLDVAVVKDKKGKAYYQFQVLTRTGDGNEGGRHQLIKATVSNGTLYILKVQSGDKRWFKGAKKDCEGVLESFTVA